MSLLEKVGRVILNAPRRSRSVRPDRQVKDNRSYRLPSFSLCFVVALVATVFISAPIHAETVLTVPTAPESQATIRVAAPWTQNPRFGFAPVRITIENRAPNERTWNVQFQAGMRNFSIGVLNSDQAITVPAGQTRDVWVFVPIAEPGVNIPPGRFARWHPAAAAAGLVSAPVIVNLPSGGKKVTRMTVAADKTTTMIETIIDPVAGKIITTTTPDSAAPSTRTRSFPLNRGTAVTIAIDPNTGVVGTPRVRSVSGMGPARVNITTATTGGRTPPGTVSAMGGGAAVSTIGPSTAMVLMAEFTGPGVQGAGRINFPGSMGTNEMRAFVVSPSLESKLRSRLASLVSGAPNLSVIDPRQVPADWRMWSSFSGMLLTTDEYAALDNARKAALRAWVGLGGQLCLIPANAEAASGNDSSTEKIGAGIIVTLAEPLSAVSPTAAAGPASTETEKDRAERWRAEVAARRATRAAGMPAAGTPATPAPVLRPEEFFPLGPEVKLFQGTNGLPDQSALQLDPFGALGEYAGNDVGDNPWLAVFLVVFAVVVGPVNLFIFAPANRRHRLFLTTPLIALAASILLGAAILAEDGIGGGGVRRTLVVVLPDDNQTAVFQEQAVRTGFLLGRTFALPEDVQLTSLPLNEPRWGGPATTFLRQGSRAGGDWFQNRARDAHLLQRVVPSRGRVEQVGAGADGAPIVQSSLGATLQDFVCFDEAGQPWKTGELAPGRRVTLERGGTWIGKSANATTVPGGSRRFKEVFDTALETLPGRWCARGTATELAPIATLSAIRWEDGDIIYAGTLETTAAAGTNGETPARAKTPSQNEGGGP
jgi:hypothetical protein